MAAQSVWGRAFIRGKEGLTFTVILLIISLIPLTGIWPTAGNGRWTREFAAWASLGPVIVSSAMLLWSGNASNRRLATES